MVIVILTGVARLGRDRELRLAAQLVRASSFRISLRLVSFASVVRYGLH